MEQYNVTGMSCAACSARVEKAVSKVPGVNSCSVSLLTNSMGVEGTASSGEIIAAVEAAVQRTMRALADTTRRTILNLLKDGPVSAGDIAAHFDISGPAVSRHLSVLKDADLIRDRREGKYILYELNASVLDEALLWLAGLRGEKRP